MEDEFSYLMLLDLIICSLKSTREKMGNYDLHAAILVMVTATFVNVLYFVSLLITFNISSPTSVRISITFTCGKRGEAFHLNKQATKFEGGTVFQHRLQPHSMNFPKYNYLCRMTIYLGQ